RDSGVGQDWCRRNEAIRRQSSRRKAAKGWVLYQWNPSHARRNDDADVIRAVRLGALEQRDCYARNTRDCLYLTNKFALIKCALGVVQYNANSRADLRINRGGRGIRRQCDRHRNVHGARDHRFDKYIRRCVLGDGDFVCQNLHKRWVLSAYDEVLCSKVAYRDRAAIWNTASSDTGQIPCAR